MNNIAIWISLFSLIVATIALGWNIYKEFMKPKLKVNFFFGFNIRENGTTTPIRLILSTTNFGPGKIIVRDYAILKARWAFFKKLFKKDYYEPLQLTSRTDEIKKLLHLGSIFPESQGRLDRGEQEYYYVDYDKNKFLMRKEFIKIGLVDSFDRIHWAPRRDYKRVKKEYEKTFKGEE
jgi:hypothetical protein